MKSLESDLNKMKSSYRNLKNLSALMEDSQKARKLDQILSGVDVDDLIGAVELFKETAAEDDVNATNMTGHYAPQFLDNSLNNSNMLGNLQATSALGKPQN